MRVSTCFCLRWLLAERASLRHSFISCFSVISVWSGSSWPTVVYKCFYFYGQILVCRFVQVLIGAFFTFFYIWLLWLCQCAFSHESIRNCTAGLVPFEKISSTHWISFLGLRSQLPGCSEVIMSTHEQQCISPPQCCCLALWSKRLVIAA